MNIGGDVSENADIFTIDELNFKRALKEYASLKNTFGIDRNESTHDSCLDEFTQNKLLYTIVNTSDLKRLMIQVCHMALYRFLIFQRVLNQFLCL